MLKRTSVIAGVTLLLFSVTTLVVGDHFWCKKHPNWPGCKAPAPVPPTPVPPVPPDPVPPTPVPPTPIAGFRVLIIEETADRGKLPIDQREILMGTGAGSVRAWLNGACVKDSKGNPDWRLFDKDTSLAKEPAIWQQIAASPHPNIVTPYWIISTAAAMTVAPLPANKADALTILNAAVAPPAKKGN